MGLNGFKNLLYNPHYSHLIGKLRTEKEISIPDDEKEGGKYKEQEGRNDVKEDMTDYEIPLPLIPQRKMFVLMMTGAGVCLLPSIIFLSLLSNLCFVSACLQDLRILSGFPITWS